MRCGGRHAPGLPVLLRRPEREDAVVHAAEPVQKRLKLLALEEAYLGGRRRGGLERGRRTGGARPAARWLQPGVVVQPASAGSVTAMGRHSAGCVQIAARGRQRFVDCVCRTVQAVPPTLMSAEPEMVEDEGRRRPRGFGADAFAEELREITRGRGRAGVAVGRFRRARVVPLADGGGVAPPSPPGVISDVAVEARAGARAIDFEEVARTQQPLQPATHAQRRSARASTRATSTKGWIRPTSCRWPARNSLLRAVHALRNSPCPGTRPRPGRQRHHRHRSLS